jgi:hypothetical protein
MARAARSLLAAPIRYPGRIDQPDRRRVRVERFIDPHDESGAGPRRRSRGRRNRFIGPVGDDDLRREAATTVPTSASAVWTWSPNSRTA